jgi:hypothetical protein
VRSYGRSPGDAMRGMSHTMRPANRTGGDCRCDRSASEGGILSPWLARSIHALPSAPLCRATRSPKPRASLVARQPRCAVGQRGTTASITVIESTIRPSSKDRYSADTPEVVQAAKRAWEARGARDNLEHVRYKGGHALTQERTEKIISWVTAQARR